MDQHGKPSYCIQVDTTDFSKINWASLLNQIENWKEKTMNSRNTFDENAQKTCLHCENGTIHDLRKL